MKTKRKYSLMMVSGAVMIIAGLALPVFGMYDTCVTTMGAVLIAVAALRHWQYGDEREVDERTKRIRAYGRSYALQLSLIFLFILFWVDFLGILTLTAQDIIVATALVMALSTLIFIRYFSRKGDIE